MNIGQIVTLLRPNETAGADAVAEVAIVVRKGTAKVPNPDGGPNVDQPYVSLRVITAQGGELPFVTRVPAYDSEAAARETGAAKWSAYTAYADPNASSNDLGIPDQPAAPIVPPAPAEVPPVTFEDD